MSSDFQDNIEGKEEEFPQHLCKTCGKCCRSIITSYSYDELKQMADEGEPEAKVFIEIFKPYESIEDARAIVPDHVNQILDTLKERGVDESKINFFYCPHVTEQNLCSIYEERPDCCRRAPRNGWSLFPPDCGFKGWQFEQREKHKKNIRELKEYLYTMESIAIDGKIPGKDITIDELKRQIEEKIKPWERFGALYW